MVKRERKSRSRLGRLVGLALMGLAGCSQQAKPASLGGQNEVEPMRRTQAHWQYHPLKKARRTAVLTLASGEQLEVDEAGTRWMLRSGEEAEASPYFAPEALVGIRQVGKAWEALGKSGTVYSFAQPLGPFEHVRTPPQPLLRAQFASQGIVGVGEDGSLHRSSDFGKTWKRVRRPEFFTHVVPNGEGELLALSVPEKWHRSEDGGRTYERVNLPPVAPRTVRAEAGQAVVEGLYGAFTVNEGRWKKLGAKPFVQDKYPLPRMAAAKEVNEGRASMSGGEYLGLSHEGEDWLWHRGALGAPLSTGKVRGLPHCPDYRIAHFGEHVLVVCAQKSRGAAGKLRAFRSGDGGKSFAPVKQKLRGNWAALRFSVAPRGEAALIGLCPLHLTEAGCEPTGMVQLGPKTRSKYRDVPSMRLPSVIAAAPDGAVWGLGERDKDGHVLLVRMAQDVPDQLWDLSREAGFPIQQRLEHQLLVAEDGSLSAVSSRGGVLYVAGLDESRLELTFARGPADVQEVAGVGERLLALNVADNFVWESQTGGLSWARRALPRSVCEDVVGCEVPLICSEQGCLVGHELVRLGWGEDSAQAPVALPLSASETVEPRESAGLSCTATGKWEPLPGLLQFPTASDSGYRTTLWAQASMNAERATAKAVHVAYGDPTLRWHELLSPVSAPKDYQMGSGFQVEGVAVFRQHLAPGGTNLQATKIEVAWDNRITDTIGKGGLSQYFSHPPMRRDGANLSPPYLGVTGHGFFLELFDGSTASRQSYFFSDSPKPERVPEVQFPEPGREAGGWLASSSVGKTRRMERLRVHGQSEEVLLLAASRVMVRRWRDPMRGGELTHSPYLMGILSDQYVRQAQGVYVSYLGEKVGFVSVQVDTEGQSHRANYVGLGERTAFEEPLPVPLQADLPRVPRRCTPLDRRSSPRVVAPAFPGPSRQVTIEKLEQKKLKFEVGSAVLYGSLDNPCVATWEARPARSASNQDDVRYRAILDPSTKKTSWLFRARAGAGRARAVDVRAMTCGLDGVEGSGAQ